MHPETPIFVKAVIALFKGVPRIDGVGSAPISSEEMLARHGVFVTDAARDALPNLGDYAEYIAETHGYDIQKANAGLFDTFARVKSAQPEEFFVHQVLHYFSVYVQNGMDDRDTRGVDSSIVHIPRRDLDLPDGDPEKMKKSLKKLYDLGGDLKVYPGHMQSTTLDTERKYNHYMQGL